MSNTSLPAENELVCGGCGEKFFHLKYPDSREWNPEFCDDCEGLVKSISIRDFRGFRDEQKIILGQYNGNPGSGITYLVGENNSGKTTFLRALLNVFTVGNFSEDERRRPHIMRITTEGVSQGLLIKQSWEYGRNNIHEFGEIARVKSLTPNYGGKPLRSSYSSRDFWNSVIFIGSKRSWRAKFKLPKKFIDNNHTDRIHQLIWKYGGVNEWNTIYNEEFEKFIYAIYVGFLGDDYKGKLNSLIRNIVPDFNDWEIEKIGKGSFIVKYIPKSGRPYQIDYLGEGVLSIFKIMAGFLMGEGLFCIDEPELNLHPGYQKRLSKFLGEKSARNQIMISTHSPYFIEWSFLRNGAALARFFKKGDKCKIAQINRNAPYFEILTRIDSFQPHLLDLTAKEIFFVNSILLVEGQEDYGLLNRFISEEQIGIQLNFFGYGSGGAERITHLLELCKDLHLIAGVIFDADKTHLFYVCKRSFKDFHFKKWTTVDIRDKGNKQGLFDKNGKIKGKQEKREVENTLKYFADKFGR